MQRPTPRKRELGVDAHNQYFAIARSRYSVYRPDRICKTSRDDVLVLPLNQKDEIIEHRWFIGESVSNFVVPVPNVKVD